MTNRRLVAILALQLATAQLTVVSAALKFVLSDIYFVAAMALVVRDLQVANRVHTAVQGAQDAAGIESPYPTQNVNLQVAPDAVAQVSGLVTRSGSRTRRRWPRAEGRRAGLPLPVHENET